MVERKKYLFKAKLAAHANRYNEVLVAMKKVAFTASSNDELNFEERNLILLAYKSLIDPRRLSWRTIRSIEREEENKGNVVRVALIKAYREKIEKELRNICWDVFHLLDRLIRHASTGENKVFFYKMEGDYYRYLAEFANGTDYDVAVDRAQNAYEAATNIAIRDLSPMHPYSLKLALNFSVFYFDILRLPDKAYRLAKEAFDAVSSVTAELDNLNDDCYQHCTRLMHLLHNNLALWKSANQSVIDGEEERLKQKMLKRKNDLFKAKLAEAAKRYDEMLDIMANVAFNNIGELNVEERHFLSVAYKSLIEPRRLSWRTIRSIEREEENKGNVVRVALIKAYREQIEKEMRNICRDVFVMLRNLIRHASTGESKVFYFKMKGDYYRYLAEFVNGTDREVVAEGAQNAYEAATDIAIRDLSPTHPYSLELALNFSVFYYKILNLPAKAYRLAKEAFDAVTAELDYLGDDSVKDCTRLMHLLHDILTLCTMAGQVAGDCEQNKIIEDGEGLDTSGTQPPLAYA